MLASIVHLFRIDLPKQALESPIRELPGGRGGSKVGLARELEKILLAPTEQAFPLLL
jgi:hypothetical protein